MSTANKGRSVMAQGRIVWVSGDLFKGRTKTDMNTRQPIIDVKTGLAKIEYGFGLAIPKSALQNTAAGQPGEVWAAMHEEAYTLFPSRQLPPGFAMKYKDGDGIDDKGVSFAQREGHAGHIILACTTSLKPKFYRWENGQNFEITEGIKCGDYVDVQLTLKAHPAVGTHKAGLYVNPSAVRFLGFGAAIVNTPSGDAIFGAAAPVMPQGASATPLSPAGMIAPMGAVAPAPAHYGVLPQVHQPIPNASPSAPAAPATTPQPPPAFAAPVAAPAGNGFPVPGGFPIPGQG